jgi:hypothetical protein
MSPPVQLTFFPRLRDAQGQRVVTTWDRLLAKLTRPRVAEDKHDVPGISLATYRDDRRSRDRVERVYAVGLDFDHDLKWDVLVERLAAVDAFIHTTHSSTDAAPRARAFIRLSRPVDADEYERVYRAACMVCESGGLVVDYKAKDASRFWFLPSIPPGGRFLFSIGRGKPANVEEALRKIPAEAPAPVVPPCSAPPSNAEERAQKYLDRCPGAVSGQGGHNDTFLVAQRLVRGFCLDEEAAYRLMLEWNRRCDPPWSERELRRKIRQAAQRGTMAYGALADRPRRAS